MAIAIVFWMQYQWQYQYQLFVEYNTNCNTNTNCFWNAISMAIPIPIVCVIQYQWQYQYQFFFLCNFNINCNSNTFNCLRTNSNVQAINSYWNLPISIAIPIVPDLHKQLSMAMAIPSKTAIPMAPQYYCSCLHCSQRITGSRIVTNRSGHFVPIALIGLGKLLHRLCAFDFFKGNIALQNSLQDLPFFQSHMQSLAKAWYRKERRMLCKFQNLFSKVH